MSSLFFDRFDKLKNRKNGGFRADPLVICTPKVRQTFGVHIISTHSPILITMPNSDVYQLTGQGIDKVSFDQTEHYTISRRFLENPTKMLKYLLEEDDA